MNITVEHVEVLHRAAQARLGLYASLVASYSFPSFSGSKEPVLDDWTSLLVEQILELRELSRDLAVTYYQLARWLETGFSLGSPVDSGVTTGAGLFSSFIARVRAVDDMRSSDVEIGRDIAAALRADKSNPLNDSTLAGDIEALEGGVFPDGVVRVDPFGWPVLSDGERARKTIVSSLVNSSNLSGRYRSVDGVDAGGNVDDLLKAYDSAVSGGATRADNLVMVSGRSVVEYAQGSDSRVLMYARCTSSNPCAFCAMLASRGFVYVSEGAAAGVKSYHDNCHCFPISRWSDSSELPVLNKFFQDNWGRVTGGFSGNDKLNAWRRWLNAERRKKAGG